MERRVLEDNLAFRKKYTAKKAENDVTVTIDHVREIFRGLESGYGASFRSSNDLFE